MVRRLGAGALTLTLALGAGFAGCTTVGPSYQGPPPVAETATARGAFVRAADPALTRAPGLARWWETLDDPTLTRLVDDALAHSPSIELATARLREALGSLGAQRAADAPKVGASATYLRARIPTGTLGSLGSGGAAGAAGPGPSSETFNFYNLGGTASWEPDLFGGNRRGVEEARAGLGRAYAQLADAQVSLTAQVAQAYVSLRDVQVRIRLNQRSAGLQTRALALTRQRRAAGTASELDIQRLQTQLNATNAEILPLGAQLDEYRDQLAVLTGREPGALDATLAPAAAADTTPVPVPLPPPAVPIGDPGALIAHRPDVREAERQLAASTAEIGVQRARMYPSVSFYGLFGLGGTRARDVVDTGTLTTLLLPQINWTFLDFGRNRANLEKATAQRDEAEAQYRQAVLAALQDAETSLSRFGNVRLQLAQLTESERASARAAMLNRQRVARGTSSTIDQLDIERQHLAAEISVAQAQAQLTDSYIAVQKALGLGWSEPAADAASPAITAGSPADSARRR